jgi:hypothetical protein
MNTGPAAAQTRAAWRKSSYSTGTGNCVEVSPAADDVLIRHSKHPSAGTISFPHPAWAAFVREAWRKSSYSSATGNCVEVSPAADDVLIRHSKHPAAGTISFPHPAWAAFVREAPEDGTGSNGVATITRTGTDTLVKSLTTGIELRFDEGEWSAFVAGAADGEFDFAAEPGSV